MKDKRKELITESNITDTKKLKINGIPHRKRNGEEQMNYKKINTTKGMKT